MTLQAYKTILLLCSSSVHAHRPLLLCGLYPDLQGDEQLPQGTPVPDLRPRIETLERELRHARWQLQQYATPGRQPTSSDANTFALRVSLGLWLLLAGVSTLQCLKKRAISALGCLLISTAGSVVTLTTLVYVLIDYIKHRVLRIEAPRIRCHRCFTIFEVPRKAERASCPQCGTMNKVVKTTMA